MKNAALALVLYLLLVNWKRVYEIVYIPWAIGYIIIGTYSSYNYREGLDVYVILTFFTLVLYNTLFFVLCEAFCWAWRKRRWVLLGGLTLLQINAPTPQR